MATIKNIIFDLGGVLLDIDYHKTTEGFKKLGIKNFDELFSQFKSNPLFEKLETGNITEEEFYRSIRTYINNETTKEEIDRAWNAMILDFRKESLVFLDSISNRYDLFLLSNTNSIHFDVFHDLLKQQMGIDSLDSYFKKSYYSHLIKKRKPYADTYRFVLEDAAILAEETLFIDDSLNNIESAATLGIHTYHLLPGERIETINFKEKR